MITECLVDGRSTPQISQVFRDPADRQISVHDTQGTLDAQKLGGFGNGKLWQRNLVLRALRLVDRPASVVLRKRIPAGAGLGGGSADAAAALRFAGCADVELAVLTRSEAGSVILHGGTVVTIGAEPAKVVDTTGAGDAYAAGFLTGLCAIVGGTLTVAAAVDRGLYEGGTRLKKLQSKNM